MAIQLPSSAIATQTVTILTDIQVTHSSIVCPITATLSPSFAYISLSADYSTIAVNAALLTSPSDLGVDDFTLTVNSASFPTSVAQKTYIFSVIFSCTLSNLQFTSLIPNTSYIINSGSVSTSAF